MPGPLNLLFQGVTTSPARELIVEEIQRGSYEQVVFPCVGSWTVAIAAGKAGVDPA